MNVVDEIRQNREKGAKRLESEYKAGLMALASRFCNDSSDAEELVNATFATVVEKIDDYLEQSAFFGWMCQIMTTKELLKDIRRRIAKGESKKDIYNQYAWTEWETAVTRFLPTQVSI